MPVPPLPATRNRDAPANDPANADPAALRAIIQKLTLRIRELEEENAALTYSAECFSALAERLNAALRQRHD